MWHDSTMLTRKVRGCHYDFLLENVKTLDEYGTVGSATPREGGAFNVFLLKSQDKDREILVLYVEGVA